MARRTTITGRVWAWVSAGLALVMTLTYVGIIAAQGDDSFGDVAWWAALMLMGAGAALAAAVARNPRTAWSCAVAAAVVLGALGLVSILTIGLGFLLAAAAAAAAVVRLRPVAT